MNNIQKYKADLETLVTLGEKMKEDLVRRNEKKEYVTTKETVCLENCYQRWYTESFVVIKQLLPDRLTEFERLYMEDRRRKEIDNTTFTIQDWLKGFRAGSYSSGEKTFDDFGAMGMRFFNQLEMLKSVEARFDSTLFDIKQFVQADLFDSELETARELANHGFLRAAGSIAGVVLEKHLGQVVDNHNIKTRKKDPTISDFNDFLKKGGVLDVPSWRQIQRLGDIRNLCSHDKKREPTREEVEELIRGVEKYMKTLF